MLTALNLDSKILMYNTVDQCASVPPSLPPPTWVRQGYMDPVVSKENTISTGPPSTPEDGAAAAAVAAASSTLGFLVGGDPGFSSSSGDRKEGEREERGKRERERGEASYAAHNVWLYVHAYAAAQNNTQLLPCVLLVCMYMYMHFKLYIISMPTFLFLFLSSSFAASSSLPACPSGGLRL